jgi:RNA polymerase sigma factor (sigma-70 family)
VPRLELRGDDALYAVAADGDASAFGAVYERHRHALYRYCRSIVDDHEDAVDAVQNTMVKAWESLQRGAPGVPLRPWLFRIAHNEAVTVVRRRRAYEELADIHVVAPWSTDDAYDTRERLDRLRADLAALPASQRSALLLRELCGLGHDEIATVLVVSPATARQAIYEARLGLHDAEAGRALDCDRVRRKLSDGDGRVRRGRQIRSHLRACASCAAFDGAMRRRPGDLAALVAPLPGAPAVGVLGRLLCAGGASGPGPSDGRGLVPAIAGAGDAVAQTVSVVAATVTLGAAVAVGVGGAGAVDRGPTSPAGRPAAATATRLAPQARAGAGTIALPQAARLPRALRDPSPAADVPPGRAPAAALPAVAAPPVMPSAPQSRDGGVAPATGTNGVAGAPGAGTTNEAGAGAGTPSEAKAGTPGGTDAASATGAAPDRPTHDGGKPPAAPRPARTGAPGTTGAPPAPTPAPPAPPAAHHRSNAATQSPAPGSPASERPARSQPPPGPSPSQRGSGSQPATQPIAKPDPGAAGRGQQPSPGPASGHQAAATPQASPTGPGADGSSRTLGQSPAPRTQAPTASSTTPVAQGNPASARNGRPLSGA